MLLWCNCEVGLARCAVQSVKCECQTAWMKAAWQTTCVGARRRRDLRRVCGATQTFCFISWAHTCGHPASSSASCRATQLLDHAPLAKIVPPTIGQHIGVSQQKPELYFFSHLTRRFCCLGQGGERPREGRQAVGSSAVLGRQHASEGLCDMAGAACWLAAGPRQSGQGSCCLAEQSCGCCLAAVEGRCHIPAGA